LPDGISQEELRSHFSGAGTVLFVGRQWRTNVPTSSPISDQEKGTTEHCVAEVRYESPMEAQQAVDILDGSLLEGVKISVMLDQSSHDGSKILVTQLPAGVQWQAVKDHCSHGGRVVFTNVRHASVKVRQQVSRGAARTNSGAEGELMGEVRFDSPNDTLAAFNQLHGSWLGDRQIWLSLDPHSPDQTKLFVSGLAPFTQWQELKDHFGCIGSVAFAQVKSEAGGFHQGSASMGLRSGGKYGPWGGGGPKGACGKAMLPANRMWGLPHPSEVWASGKGTTYCKGAGNRPCRAMAADGSSPPGTCSGEVRYDNPYCAQVAAEKLSGSFLHGAQISVKFDVGSKDGSKVFVYGIPPGCQWQELKDHFGQLGQVAFATIAGPCEVRMGSHEEAQQALAMYNGTDVKGSVISVLPDRTSKDGTRLLVCGLPLSCAWQEVKDMFSQAGTVAFVNRPTSN